jgi:hypothetical protein
MNHTDTQLELIQYLYNELDEKQNFKMVRIINSKNELKKDYEAYKEVKDLLSTFVLKAPNSLFEK